MSAISDAVQLLLAAGRTVDEVKNLLDAPLRWAPRIPREVWETFGDGGSYDDLKAEDERREAEGSARSAAWRAAERRDTERVMWVAYRITDRSEVERLMGGEIEDKVWEEAVRLAAEKKAANERRPEGQRMVDIAEVLLIEIEDDDRRTKEAGFTPAPYMTFLSVLRRMVIDSPHERDGTPGELVSRMYGATGGKIVDVGNAPRIAVAALRSYGIPVGVRTFDACLD